MSNDIKFKHTDEETKGHFLAKAGKADAGIMTYTWVGDDRIIIDHTVVEPDFRGQKIGKNLVLRAVDFARKKKANVIPLCPFAKAVFDRHEDLQDVL